MPTGFWGDAQRARYGRFPDAVGENDIARCFHLDESDRGSPPSHRHSNFLGRYAFTLSEAVARGQLRRLRDPIPNRTFATPYVSRPFRSHARSVKKGKTAVLTAEEARDLLDSIGTDTPAGLRDRALIALMVYTFARVRAVLKMRTEDVFIHGRRTWVRLHEKGGKHHEMPCHHKLEAYLQDYAAARPSSLPPDPKV